MLWQWPSRSIAIVHIVGFNRLYIIARLPWCLVITRLGALCVGRTQSLTLLLDEIFPLKCFTMLLLCRCGFYLDLLYLCSIFGWSVRECHFTLLVDRFIKGFSYHGCGSSA